MKVSELSERSGVPLSSIKFYIREGLLPPGARTHRNQALYDDTHVERLRLIRGLREVAGLSVDVLRRVLAAIDEQGERGRDPVHAALEAVYPARPADAEPDPEYEELAQEVRTVLRDLPWTTADERHFYVHQLVEALRMLRTYVSPAYGAEHLRPLAAAAWASSQAEYASAPSSAVPSTGDDLTEPVRRAVLGTLLFEPVVLALRRAANAARAQRLMQGMPLPPGE